MANAANSPAVNDTMEDRTMAIPTASAVVRPVMVVASVAILKF